ncbi:MAG: hypothetical protein PHW47_09660, partial [Lachnospira sp.]|nr:hypothetical protein [Lachnospira sp.]
MKKSGRNGRTYKPAGVLKSFFTWPLFVAILLVIVNILVYTHSSSAGILVSAFTVVYLVVLALTMLYLRPRIMHEMIE